LAFPLSSGQRSALRGNVGVFLCVDLFLDSGLCSFWDGPENVIIGERTYVATGAYAGATAASSGAHMSAQGVQLSLDASRLLADAADETDPAYFLSTIISEGGYRQRRVEMAYSVWSADPIAHVMQRRCFTGLIDQMEIREAPGGDDGRGQSILLVRCESLALRYGQRVGRTRSHEDQQEIYPGDDFFKAASGSIATERNLMWGRSNSGIPGGSVPYSPSDIKSHDLVKNIRY